MMTIWTDNSGKVVQADASDPETPVSIDGCTATVLDEAQATAFDAAQAAPNGGVTFDGKKFTALAVVTPKAVTSPLLTQAKAATDVASLQAVVVKLLGG